MRAIARDSSALIAAKTGDSGSAAGSDDGIVTTSSANKTFRIFTLFE
jgi:hypothetical protein